MYSYQIYRLRSLVVKAILAQEISWHDSRTTDGLAVRVSEYKKVINQNQEKYFYSNRFML
jgi:hypothetical protein